MKPIRHSTLSQVAYIPAYIFSMQVWDCAWPLRAASEFPFL